MKSISIKIIGIALWILSTMAAPQAGLISQTSVHRQNSSLRYRALSVLKGRTAYLCKVESTLNYSASYGFSNIKDADGKEVLFKNIPQYFRTNDKISILSAQEVDNGLSLRIKDAITGAQADLRISVDKTWFRNPYDGVVGNGFLSKYPVEGLPRIGMEEMDVYCRLDLPDRTNSDALGGDQLVYQNGHIYVYISAKTGRVTNIQTSY